MNYFQFVALFLPLQPLVNADAFLPNAAYTFVCVGAKPKRHSGHFLPNRSQREQLSMRVSHKTDSPLCGGQPCHFQSGDIHFGKCPPPTHFSSTMHFLHPATNQTPSASVSFSPPARNSNRKRCGATSSLKTNKQHNTTGHSHGESLGMDYLSLNTHTTSSISLFSSQHVLFCDPNYNSQLGG